uniref:Uncharacterized protein n=1 Tax=Chrysotila carterae TaxID=13221 RepID=A0A7S4C5A9_CHRCT
MAIGDDCKIDSDCDGAAVVCERDECSCPWYTQMQGPDCEDLSAGSAWALSNRTLIIIAYSVVFVYAALIMRKIIIQVQRLTPVRWSGRKTFILLSLAQCTCVLEVGLNLLHIADVAGAKIDKQLIAVGGSSVETVAACCGMLVLLHVSLLWIAVCEQSNTLKVSVSAKRERVIEARLKRFTAAYTLLFISGCIGCIFILLLVSVLAYYVVFFGLLTITAGVLILTYQIGAYRLAKQLHGAEVAIQTKMPRYTRVVQRTRATAAHVSAGLLCCLVALGSSYFAYWDALSRSLPFAWLACILLFHLGASWALFAGCRAIGNMADSALSTIVNSRILSDESSSRVPQV